MSGRKAAKGGKSGNNASAKAGDDILLKTKVERVKEVKDARPSSHRVEMQTLYMNKDSENLIMETLKHIHGPEFALKNRSLYRDKGGNLNKQYWIGRGNLVVQGGVDYSAKTKEQAENDIINMFAVSKLERYGFHKSHCLEALDITQGDVGTALELLQNEYFNLSIKFPSLKLLNPNEEDDDDDENLQMASTDRLLQRQEEKESLECIYEGQFEERITNKMWIIDLDLEYLIKFHEPHAEEESWDSDFIKKKPSSKTEMCSFFAKGHCKFGQSCRFSHRAITPPIAEQKPDKHLFQLEIRFGEGSKYPAEVPFVFLTTTAPNFPSEACMRISHHLIQEAKIYAQMESPCVYSLIALLTSDPGRIGTVLLEDEQIGGLFLDPKRFLFPPPEVEEELIEKEESVEVKKVFKRLPRQQASLTDLLKEDANIARKYREIQSNARYKKFIHSRSELPAWAKQDDILSAVMRNQVVVISGETGCGKSTQIPQFILDDWLQNRSRDSHVDIICTQPRRISAIGVAERVAEERAERVGNTVGYQIRLESKISSSTRLLFCTTGILLRRLESDSLLSNVTHVIVDEVHERSEESDFLLLILRDLLPIRPELKVILMSATLNAELFSQYFDGVPTLEIPGRTFPVEQYFLEDIVECMPNFAIEENSTYARRNMKWHRGDEDVWETELETADVKATVNVHPKSSDDIISLKQMMARYAGFSHKTVKSLHLMDSNKINYDLIESVILWIIEGDHDYPREGSILVFLPGMAEITTLHDQLDNHPDLTPRSGRFILLPLHSTLSSEDQAAVFKKPKPGCRKIVLSTNIAETSVTIDDCVFVIDCGKMKEKRFDSNKNMESLDLVWVSRANAMQRKGRAGRVMPGVCIHLFTSHRYQMEFLAQPIPELHRVPLEQLLLRIKTLPNFADRDPHTVLAGTIEPPADENIDSALIRLKDVGALDTDMELTPLGRHLAALPVDVRVGKLMLFGAIFCCVDSALTIAACLSHKSPFVAPFAKKDAADQRKKTFAMGNSDHLTVLKAYQSWHAVYAKSKYAAKNYATENFLSYRVLLTLGEIKQQFLELLASIGFVDDSVCRGRRGGFDNVKLHTGDALNVNGDSPKLLSAMLCAALYPNVVKILTPEKSFGHSVGGAVPKEISATEIKFKTKDDGYVNLHPSSVNYSVSYYASPYLVYQEKVKTSRIFIRDCSMAHMMPLILFAGSSLKVELFQGVFMLTLEDGWIKFGVDTHQIAEMLYQIRIELVKLLEEKIEDPTLNLLTHDNGKKIISTIVHLIT